MSASWRLTVYKDDIERALGACLTKVHQAEDAGDRDAELYWSGATNAFDYLLNKDIGSGAEAITAILAKPIGAISEKGNMNA